MDPNAPCCEWRQPPLAARGAAIPQLAQFRRAHARMAARFMSRCPGGKAIRTGASLPSTPRRAKCCDGSICVRPALRRAPGRSGSWRRPLNTAIYPQPYLVVLNEYANFATVIDTATDAVIGDFETGFYGEDLVFNKTGTRLYITDRFKDQVRAFDITRGPIFTQIAEIATGANDLDRANPRDLALSEDGTQLYVANTLGHTIAVINTETLTLKKNMIAGGLATDVKIAGPWGIVSGHSSTNALNQPETGNGMPKRVGPNGFIRNNGSPLRLSAGDVRHHARDHVRRSGQRSARSSARRRTSSCSGMWTWAAISRCWRFPARWWISATGRRLRRSFGAAGRSRCSFAAICCSSASCIPIRSKSFTSTAPRRIPRKC